MWKWGLEATASGALVRTPVPSGVEPAVRPACRWLGMAKPDPGGVAQRERRRGFWPDAEGAGWEVFRGPVPEGREGSAYHPANARSILSLFEHLAPGWALGGHPETSAHPGVEGTRFGQAGPLRAGDGLVGEKTLFACGTGPAGDGVVCPEEYSGLAAVGLTPCRGSQVFRRRVGGHSQRTMGKEVSFHPDPASRVLFPSLGSNGMVQVVVRLGVSRGLPTVAGAEVSRSCSGYGPSISGDQWTGAGRSGTPGDPGLPTPLGYGSAAGGGR